VTKILSASDFARLTLVRPDMPTQPPPSQPPPTVTVTAATAAAGNFKYLGQLLSEQFGRIRTGRLLFQSSSDGKEHNGGIRNLGGAQPNLGGCSKYQTHLETERHMTTEKLLFHRGPSSWYGSETNFLFPFTVFQSIFLLNSRRLVHPFIESLYGRRRTPPLQCFFKFGT
jgi:hypothetical protein